MGATGKKMSSFLLTHYTGSCFYLFQNNLIKMWDKFRFLEFALIILLILIEQIFLMPNVHSFVGYWFVYFSPDPVLLCALIPIKIYSNAEAEKDKIISDNKNKSGIYMWKNIINDKQYIGSAIDLSKRAVELLFYRLYGEYIKNK